MENVKVGDEIEVVKRGTVCQIVHNSEGTVYSIMGDNESPWSVTQVKNPNSLEVLNVAASTK